MNNFCLVLDLSFLSKINTIKSSLRKHDAEKLLGALIRSFLITDHCVSPKIWYVAFWTSYEVRSLRKICINDESKRTHSPL